MDSCLHHLGLLVTKYWYDDWMNVFYELLNFRKSSQLEKNSRKQQHTFFFFVFQGKSKKTVITSYFILKLVVPSILVRRITHLHLHFNATPQICIFVHF